MRVNRGTTLWGTCVATIVIFTQQVLADSSCIYIDDSKELVHVKSLQAAPVQFRSRVVCKDIAVDEVADPKNIELGNDTRTALFTTDLGPMRVRWPRAVEKCFTSSPSRAVSEVAQAVNRAVKSGRFTSELKYSRREWSLVFVDRVTAFAQFPLALSMGQHPGFMIPPSRIYIITDVVAPDCSQHVVADEALTQVLLHEMGHVLEYVMLGERDDTLDRQRAEGFAAWFEQYSADFTSIIPHNLVKQQYASLARGSTVSLDVGFSGTPEDYARSALQFQAIVDKKGIAGLMRVYQVIRDEHLPFLDAVERAIGWNRSMLMRQMSEVQRH